MERPLAHKGGMVNWITTRHAGVKRHVWGMAVPFIP